MVSKVIPLSLLSVINVLVVIQLNRISAKRLSSGILTSLPLFRRGSTVLKLEGGVNRNLNYFCIPCYTWDIFWSALGILPPNRSQLHICDKPQAWVRCCETQLIFHNQDYRKDMYAFPEIAIGH